METGQRGQEIAVSGAHRLGGVKPAELPDAVPGHHEVSFDGGATARGDRADGELLVLSDVSN